MFLKAGFSGGGGLLSSTHFPRKSRAPQSSGCSRSPVWKPSIQERRCPEVGGRGLPTAVSSKAEVSTRSCHLLGQQSSPVLIFIVIAFIFIPVTSTSHWSPSLP